MPPGQGSAPLWGDMGDGAVGVPSRGPGWWAAHLETSGSRPRGTVSVTSWPGARCWGGSGGLCPGPQQSWKETIAHAGEKRAPLLLEGVQCCRGADQGVRPQEGAKLRWLLRESHVETEAWEPATEEGEGTERARDRGPLVGQCPVTRAEHWPKS